MTRLAIGNPWLGWGLTRDPFFREAHTPEVDLPHPAERLHVGREPELVLAATQVLGATSSRAVVQGEYGVGKTSFTSRLKTVLADHGVLTHARRRVLVHVNNFENLSRQSAAAATTVSMLLRGGSR